MHMGTKKKKLRNEQNRTRTHQIKYRLSDAEYKTYLKKVEASGMTQQEYFLHVMNDSNIKIDNNLELLPELLQVLYDLLRQVKGIAVNCNQMARVCNTNRKTPTGKKCEELAESCNNFIKEGNEIWASLKQLIHRVVHTQP
jgi:hypothetical protein